MDFQRCSRRRFTLLAATLCAPLAHGGTWPERPVRMVVPYAPGGGADNTARIVGKRLGELLGQPIVIDNKPGAGGVIGADLVAKAAADGYTALYDASAFGVNGALRKLPYDPARDFIPVSLVAQAPQVLVVAANSPYRTVAELLTAARKSPGALTYASAGAGTGSHLAAEMFNYYGKVELLHVPYKGGAPALTDLMAGQVGVYFANVASALQYITAGKLRAMAVTSRQRIPALPEVPTLAESGMADYEVLEWNGIFLPRNTPSAVVERLARDAQAAVRDPQVNARLRQIGLEPVGSTPQVFQVYVLQETRRWADIVQARRITVN